MTANLKPSDFEHYLKGEHLNGRGKITRHDRRNRDRADARRGRPYRGKAGLLLQGLQERLDPVPDHMRAARACSATMCRGHGSARATGSDPLARRRSRHLAGAHQPRTTAGNDAVGRPTTAADQTTRPRRQRTGDDARLILQAEPAPSPHGALREP